MADHHDPAADPLVPIWFGLGACGCPFAWIIDKHPADLTDDDKAVIAASGRTLVEWVLLDEWPEDPAVMYHPVTHPEPEPGIFGGRVCEPGRVDFREGACTRKGSPVSDELVLGRWRP